MSEVPNFTDHRETLLPGHTLLLAEPMFKNPSEDESKQVKFTMPLGVESWVEQLAASPLSDRQIMETLANEYLSIASGLKEIGAPFRIIIAHRKDIDQTVALAILQQFKIRGLALHEAISETCFPRDMLVDFDGDVRIN